MNNPNPRPDYSRLSFKKEFAPRDQLCACQCGEFIKRGSECCSRPYVDHRRVTGHTRIVNMDHYDDWFENVAHAYSQKIVSRHPELRKYYER